MVNKVFSVEFRNYNMYKVGTNTMSTSGRGSGTKWLGDNFTILGFSQTFYIYNNTKSIWLLLTATLCRFRSCAVYLQNLTTYTLYTNMYYTTVTGWLWNLVILRFIYIAVNIFLNDNYIIFYPIKIHPWLLGKLALEKKILKEFLDWIKIWHWRL